MPHTFRTERLLLRPWRLRDAKALATIFGDRDTAKSTKTWPHPVTEEQARWRIAQWANANPVETFGFAMVYQGAPVGSLGLTQRHDTTYSIGWGVAKPLWGQGLTVEAVRALCAHAFAARGVTRIEADIFQDNPGSIRVAEKVGFRFIGDIGPGWSTVLQGNFPRYGYSLLREHLVR